MSFKIVMEQGKCLIASFHEKPVLHLLIAKLILKKYPAHNKSPLRKEPQRKPHRELNRTEHPRTTTASKTNVPPDRYHSRPANPIWRSGGGSAEDEKGGGRRTGGGSHHWTGTIRKRVPEIIDLRNGRGLG
ncbi:hypothetical protein CEXT_630821 [Caerostris extrusa]|uniref:Uncharacterized protein n=1 Tax=Caerostris extrusa TaxID=172846 RepID=A0AAV4VIA4_CAEEX|nr:hypothetical protein CEXT_630821 [Caerostris extrusa]